MAWARLDDAMCFHEKVVEAGNAAVGVWVRLISWSSQHLTDGEVPEKVARLVAGESRGALAALERANLVLRRSQSNPKDPGVYVIHDYLEYNPSKAEVEAKREKDRVRKGGISAPVPPGPTAASAPPDPTRPDPYPSQNTVHGITIGDVLARINDWDGWPTPTGLTRKAKLLAEGLGGHVSEEELSDAKTSAEGVNGSPNLGLLLSIIHRTRQERQTMTDDTAAIVARMDAINAKQ